LACAADIGADDGCDDISRVTELRQLNFRWADIATLLGIVAKTLTRWRQRVGFVEPHEELDDTELDRQILALNDCNPNRGQVTTSAE
jgi:hypothetical protein